jgi:hypothetical protein
MLHKPRFLPLTQSFTIQSKNGKNEAIALVIRIQRTGFGISGRAVSQPRLRAHPDTFTDNRKNALLIVRLGFEYITPQPTPRLARNATRLVRFIP